MGIGHQFVKSPNISGQFGCFAAISFSRELGNICECRDLIISFISGY